MEKAPSNLGESVVQLLAHDIVNVPLADNGPQTNSDTKQAGNESHEIG